MLFLAAPTVQLVFSSDVTKSTAEKFRGHILQAFETILGSPVTVEIKCESMKGAKSANGALTMPPSKDGKSQMALDLVLVGKEPQLYDAKSSAKGKNEIIEVDASPKVPKGREHTGNGLVPHRSSRGSQTRDIEASHKRLATPSTSGRKKLGDQSQSLSIVRGKVSLAHVIQQAEGCTHRNGWSKRKAVSIAEKLEQENL